MKMSWWSATLILVGMVGSGVFLHRVYRLPEPTNGGKPLSYWVDHAARNPNDLALKAIQAIGPAGIPFLLRRAAHPESLSRRVYRTTWSVLPQSLQTRLPSPKSHEETLGELAQVLGIMGPPAVPSLIAAFSSSNRDIREMAVLALTPIEPRAVNAVPGLATVLKDPDPGVRSAAVGILGLMGSNAAPAVPALIGVLQKDAIGTNRSNSIYVRGRIIQVLGGIGPRARSAVPELTRTLHDTNASTRAQAIIALWRINQDTNLVSLAISEVEKAPDAATWRQFLNALGIIGPAARPAVPMILLAISNTVRFPDAGVLGVPSEARAALEIIDPEAAAKLNRQTK